MHAVSPPDRQARPGCGQERAESSLRCGQAREAREALEAALERGRELRRRLTAARHALEEASDAADPGRRQVAKDRARTAYQGEHAKADSEGARAEAAARWARAVDAINRETRKAVRAQAQARQIVAALEGELRTAEASEQSLHVTAEAAEAACLDARVRLAACEERALAPQPATVAAPAATVAAPAALGSPGAPAPEPAAGAGSGQRLAAVDPAATMATAGAPPRPGDSARAGAAATSRNGGAGGSRPQVAGAPFGTAAAQGSVPQQRIGRGIPTVIEALLSGDRRWMERIASLVAETIGRPAPEVFAQLRELVEALAVTAGSHGYVMLDSTHEFWSRLTAEESRDVLAALARLGFQLEPSEGWHADRAPVQSDLSMALAYAGLDARSLRHLPTNAQLRELPRSIAVDAPSLLASEAPDLALDHVVRMLGHRADSLGPLWDDWGYVRPILLTDPRTLA